jgi:hypothetical protein
LLVSVASVMKVGPMNPSFIKSTVPSEFSRLAKGDLIRKQDTWGESGIHGDLAWHVTSDVPVDVVYRSSSATAQIALHTEIGAAVCAESCATP